jgi:hypothetical protein
MRSRLSGGMVGSLVQMDRALSVANRDDRVAVCCDRPVTRQQARRLYQRLWDNEPVERVPMQHWRGFNSDCVIVGNTEDTKAGLSEFVSRLLCRDRHVTTALARKRVFDRDLPQAGDTDKDIVGRIDNYVSNRGRHAGVV